MSFIRAVTRQFYKHLEFKTEMRTVSKLLYFIFLSIYGGQEQLLY